jgi:hypothetical protein
VRGRRDWNTFTNSRRQRLLRYQWQAFRPAMVFRVQGPSSSTLAVHSISMEELIACHTHRFVKHDKDSKTEEISLVPTKCRTIKVKRLPPTGNLSIADSKRCSGLIVALVSFSAIHGTLPRSHGSRTSYSFGKTVVLAVCGQVMVENRPRKRATYTKIPRSRSCCK